MRSRPPREGGETVKRGPALVSAFGFLALAVWVGAMVYAHGDVTSALCGAVAVLAIRYGVADLLNIYFGRTPRP